MYFLVVWLSMSLRSWTHQRVLQKWLEWTGSLLQWHLGSLLGLHPPATMYSSMDRQTHSREWCMNYSTLYCRHVFIVDRLAEMFAEHKSINGDTNSRKNPLWNILSLHTGYAQLIGGWGLFIPSPPPGSDANATLHTIVWAPHLLGEVLVNDAECHLVDLLILMLLQSLNLVKAYRAMMQLYFRDTNFTSACLGLKVIGIDQPSTIWALAGYVAFSDGPNQIRIYTMKFGGSALMYFSNLPGKEASTISCVPVLLPHVWNLAGAHPYWKPKNMMHLHIFFQKGWLRFGQKANLARVIQFMLWICSDIKAHPCTHTKLQTLYVLTYVRMQDKYHSSLIPPASSTNRHTWSWCPSFVAACSQYTNIHMYVHQQRCLAYTHCHQKYLALSRAWDVTTVLTDKMLLMPSRRTKIICKMSVVQ